MFWNRKLTGATALFLLNRYLVIIFLILGVTPSGQSQTVRTTARTYRVWNVSLMCTVSANRREYAY